MATTVKRLMGKAPLTLVRTDSGTVAYVYRGKPVPGSITKAERKRLVDEGYLHEVEVEVADEVEADAVKAGKVQLVPIKDVLREVGDDKAKAQTALDAELALPEDDRRSSLVEKLTKLVAVEES